MNFSPRLRAPQPLQLWDVHLGRTDPTITRQKKTLASLKLTAILHLKIAGWTTILSYWGGLFSGAN